MVFLLLGGGALMVLMAVLGMFSRAQVSTAKSFLLWMAAIGGLLAATLLLFTGRGGIAVAALALLGPLLWSWMQKPPAARSGPGPSRGAMSRDEAWAVLGLPPGSGPVAIRAAHHRLIRMAHPDAGGSQWLAARVNQARDVLLK